MKVNVVTPNGELYNEDVDYVVVSSQMNGEFAILKNHIPIISSIDKGYVKMVRGEKELFTVIINGVVEHNNNIVNVIAQEAHVGMSKKSALDHLNTVREERIEENRKRNFDFAKAERELKKNLKKAKAGQ
ncbi:MAG: ATP synthase F1 subunit epsilon [Candidatus Izimaplasma sp.]|nr:ATP synthase F1 subunit epsilon [Candidatus Izimaplasma bacterium]